MEKVRQSFGKRTAKLFLPVLIGLNVPFLYIQWDSLLNPVDLNAAAKGAMLGYWVFDYVFIPVSLVFLIIIQWLVFLPLWNRVFVKFRRVLFSSLFIGILLSVLLGAGLGYSARANKLDQQVTKLGTDDLVNSILLVSGFVVVYCVLNILTLYFLDKTYIKQLKFNKPQPK